MLLGMYCFHNIPKFEIVNKSALSSSPFYKKYLWTSLEVGLKNPKKIFWCIKNTEKAIKINTQYKGSGAKKEKGPNEEFKFKLPHINDIFSIEPMASSFCHTSDTCSVSRSKLGHKAEDKHNIFVHDEDKVLLKVINYAHGEHSASESAVEGHKGEDFHPQWVPRAGPRSKIYFDPTEVKAAIVTCGGLCPGLNDVIRAIAFTLDIYGVSDVLGICYGYRGFFDTSLTDIPLTKHVVQNIHLIGGSILGVSRGGAKTIDIVDSLERRGINMLFVLGGNGTHAGANAIHIECRKRKLKIVVIGVPKTIDNDILLIDKTFGFDTAVEEAQRAINAAYIEAQSAFHGVGIVKLMGRSSGFIAMHASLASGQVDICLIPEVPFVLQGPTGVLHHVQHLLHEKGQVVLCVAEGAGQELLKKSVGTDASGNPTLGDIGVHLQQHVKNHFKEIGIPIDVKYIDPTYMIRACRSNASDSILCAILGQNAVHGAFAGFSGITVGLCNNHHVYLPIPNVIAYDKHVDPNSRMWHRCMTATGQPNFSPP